MEYIQRGAFWVAGFPAENPYRFLMAYRKTIMSGLQPPSEYHLIVVYFKVFL